VESLNPVRVVTDSAAGISTKEAQDLNISIVPLKIQLGRKTFLEGVDVSPEEFVRHLSRKSLLPSLSSPSEADFHASYSQLCHDSEQIISIHLSSKLSDAFRSALVASEGLLGRCEIAVMDSQLISLGLRELVLSSARAAREGASLEEIVKLIRGMIPHIYIVVIGANLDYLEHGGRLSRAEAFLSSMLGVKPILILEDGEFIPMEKARGRVRALERLYEFVTEFPRIDKLSVLQSTSNREVDELVERISLTLPDLSITRAPYGPSLASIIGPDAQALIVYEGM
jgi:DegV family protein with EDD domain